MKFRLETGVGSQTRGLCLTLLNDAGVACGMVRSLFLPAPRGLFSSVAARPGHLTAGATVWTDDGREVVVAEMLQQTHYYRREADRAFRKWLRESQIRQRMVSAAKCLAEGCSVFNANVNVSGSSCGGACDRKP